MRPATHLDAQDELINGSSISAAQIVVKYDGVDGGVVLLASQSKSRQKVEESSKSPKNLKGLKSCKGHQFGVTFTEAPVLCQ